MQAEAEENKKEIEKERNEKNHRINLTVRRVLNFLKKLFYYNITINITFLL